MRAGPSTKVRIIIDVEPEAIFAKPFVPKVASSAPAEVNFASLSSTVIELPKVVELIPTTTLPSDKTKTSLGLSLFVADALMSIDATPELPQVESSVPLAKNRYTRVNEFVGVRLYSVPSEAATYSDPFGPAAAPVYLDEANWPLKSYAPSLANVLSNDTSALVDVGTPATHGVLPLESVAYATFAAIDDAATSARAMRVRRTFMNMLFCPIQLWLTRIEPTVIR